MMMPINRELRSNCELEARDRLSELQPDSKHSSTQRGKRIQFRRASLEEAALLTHLSLTLHKAPCTNITDVSPHLSGKAAVAKLISARENATGEAVDGQVRCLTTESSTTSSVTESQNSQATPETQNKHKILSNLIETIPTSDNCMQSESINMLRQDWQSSISCFNSDASAPKHNPKITAAIQINKNEETCTKGNINMKRSMFRMWSAAQRRKKRKQSCRVGSTASMGSSSSDASAMALTTRKKILDKLPSTLRDLVKKEEKKEGNRVAAKRCREKKKLYISELQQKAATLEFENLKLLRQLCSAHKMEWAPATATG